MRPCHTNLCAITLLVASLASAESLAWLPHLGSWRQVSEDGQLVLVMVSPLPVEEDAGHQYFDAEEIRSIRAAYSQSGLYPNNGDTTPLWTMSYLDWTHEVFLSPGGKHLVVADDPWEVSGHVATFYSSGAQLASYSDTDLVSWITLKSAMRWRWVNCDGIDFDSNALTFTCRTDQGERFVFDVTTGQVIGHTSPFPQYIAIAVGLIAGGIILFGMKKRQPQRGCHPRL